MTFGPMSHGRPIATGPLPEAGGGGFPILRAAPGGPGARPATLDFERDGNLLVIRVGHSAFHYDHAATRAIGHMLLDLAHRLEADQGGAQPRAGVTVTIDADDKQR